MLIESDASPTAIDDAPPPNNGKAIAGFVQTLISGGATIQTGIGGVSSMVASLLAEGSGGDYGIHSEMFATGLMRLHDPVRPRGDFVDSAERFAAGFGSLHTHEGNRRPER